MVKAREVLAEARSELKAAVDTRQEAVLISIGILE